MATAGISIGGGEQLTFNLKGGLLGGEQDERLPIGRGVQGGADFGKTLKGLAAAGGAEKETRLHREILAETPKGANEITGGKRLWLTPRPESPDLKIGCSRPHSPLVVFIIFSKVIGIDWKSLEFIEVHWLSYC
jgi:hypothetical protein